MNIRGLMICGILVATIFSCEEESCTESTKTLMNGGFYVRNDDNSALERDTMLSGITIYGLGVSGDSLLYNSENEVRNFSLPLSPNDMSASFVIMRDTIADTIVLEYEKKIVLVSTKCGFTANFTLNTARSTNNFIEDIGIGNKEVNTNNEENIKIYID